MSQPLVSVICLCHNHRAFLWECLNALLKQTYSHIEIIIVDDASTDGSQEVIKEISNQHPDFQVLLLSDNIGNTKAFNRGLAMCSGKYIIDLATDDILLPERIAKGVEVFEEYSSDVGVNFTNALNINEFGKLLNYHYPINNQGKSISPPPDGDLYALLIAKYIICSPTMMVRREVFEDLGGYDENLAYEDFDFWVRSARKYKYCYTDEVLVARRILPNSMSRMQYKRKSQQMYTTFKVCKKAKNLNRNAHERQALRMRVLYEMKQCLKVGDMKLFFKYLVFLLRV